MEDKLLENEKIASENIEPTQNLDEVVEESNESADAIAESVKNPTEESEAAQAEESVDEQPLESKDDEPKAEIDDAENQPAEEIEVAPVEEVEFIVEEKKKKLVAKDFDEGEEKKGECFFKTVKWQRIWHKIAFVLLLLLIGIPLGLLAYTIISYFL